MNSGFHAPFRSSLLGLLMGLKVADLISNHELLLALILIIAGFGAFIMDDLRNLRSGRDAS